MRAVITAGGTSEPIDDVRVVTNLSTGSFGASIATALARRGVEVTVIGSRSMLRHDWLDEAVHTVPFGSFQELADALERHTSDPPDLLFMAAAVSDYAPVPAEGKIRSSAERMTLELIRNPKLLPTLRERCPDTLLVGFKLLSGVSTDELIRVASAQRTDARLDITVANDLQAFRPGLHPIQIVDATGVSAHAGSKDEVAAALVRHVLRAARGPSSPQDLCTSHGGTCVTAGPLFDAIPELDAVYRLPPVLADSPYRGEHVLDGLASQGYRGGPFVFEAPEATVVGTLDAGHLVDVHARWTAAIGMSGRLAFVAGLPVGLTVELEGLRSLWIAPEHRGRGNGDRLVRILGQSPGTVAVPHSHAAFFLARGFRVHELRPDVAVLVPPCEAPHGYGASVCLVDPSTSQVLLGRRLRGAYLGTWSFPGGRIEPGEDALTCARRELAEETGIVVTATPVEQHVIHVGDTNQAWRVACLVILQLGRPTPCATDELDARWFDLDEAAAMPGLTAGNRWVLHRVRALLG